MPTKIILDTDIGDDVDDALALALICACPEIELLGVTTVFGNVKARARQAQTILQLASGHHASVPVAAGCSATMASRRAISPKADPDKIPGQDCCSWPAEKLQAIDPKHGVDFLIDTLMASSGDVVPVTIGAMTNMAMAILKEPAILKKIPRIVSMAAEFRTPMAEWNIRCDPEAAAHVFSSPVKIDVIPWHIGKAAMFTADESARFATSPRPVARYLHDAVAAWRAWSEKPTVQPSLFDPMAVAVLVEPGLFEWRTGEVRVELRGEETYGFTKFIAGDNRHRVAWDIDRNRAVNWYLDRVVGK